MRSHAGSPAWREAGLLTFLGIILDALALSIPIFQPIAGLLLPLVFAFIVRKYHLKMALLSLLLVTVVTYLIIGDPTLVLVFSLEVGIIGLALGLLFKNQLSPGKCLLFIIILSLGMAAVLMGFNYIVNEINPFLLKKEILNEVYLNNKFYTEIGTLSPEEQEQLNQHLEKFISMMVVLMPGSTAIWSIIRSFLVYLLAHKMFSRLGYQDRGLPVFVKWQYPWYMVWGLIAGLAFFLAGDQWGIILLSNLGKNIIYVMGFLYLVLGISVFTYFIRKWKIAIVFKGIIVFIICLYWPLGLGLVLTLGLLDSILSLRHLNTKGGPGGQGGLGG